MTAASRALRVPLVDRLSGAFFARWPGVGVLLAALETRAAEADGALPAIVRPVYVCGLARSGSTLLLEMLNAAPGFTAHRYADFPGLWTPWWWNALRARLPAAPSTPHERAHGDRLTVTRDSPEALEEVFWRHFFPQRHMPTESQVLESASRNAAFDAFYRAHIRKLLAARCATRYVSKANYHVTRLGYLADLFPDARFIIPVRDPATHVASLLRQDRRFIALAARVPAIATQLHRTGHYEFGPGKRAIHVGDDAMAATIQRDFDEGRPLHGYAHQWASLHRWLLERLQHDEPLARACLVVPYERMCAAPHEWLSRIFDHADIGTPDSGALTERYATTISAPDYADEVLSDTDRKFVADATAEVWDGIRNWCPRRPANDMPV